MHSSWRNCEAERKFHLQLEGTGWKYQQFTTTTFLFLKKKLLSLTPTHLISRNMGWPRRAAQCLSNTQEPPLSGAGPIGSAEVTPFLTRTVTRSGCYEDMATLLCFSPFCPYNFFQITAREGFPCGWPYRSICPLPRPAVTFWELSCSSIQTAAKHSHWCNWGHFRILSLKNIKHAFPRTKSLRCTH